MSLSACLLLPLAVAGSPYERTPQIVSVALNLDGSRVAANYYVPARNRPGTDWDTFVAQWDRTTGKRAILKNATSPVAFSPDGSTIAMGLWKREAKRPGARRILPRLALWKPGEQEPSRILDRGEGQDSTVLAATFAYGGSRIVSINHSGEVILWELANDKPPVVIDKLADGLAQSDRPGFRYRWGRAASLSFSPTGMGNILAVFPRPHNPREDGPAVIIWRATDGDRRRFERKLTLSHREANGSPPDLGWYLNETPAAFPVSWFPALSLLKQPPSRQRTLDRSPYAPLAVCSRDGRKWIAVTAPGRVTLVDEYGTVLDRIPCGGEVAAFSRDGKRMATANRRGILRVWNLDERRVEASLRWDEQAPHTFRVASLQAPSLWGDPAKNREALSALVNQAVWGGAKVIVLPETSVTGYMSQDLKRTWQVPGRTLSDGLTGVDPSSAAETVPGVSTEHFRRLAKGHGVYLTVPLLEVDRKTGKYYNSVVLFDPFGRQLIHYRKRNPWMWAERGWVTGGNLGNPVVDTPFGRFAVLVCFDIHKQSPILGELNVDTLLYSIAWVDDKESDWFSRKLPELAKRHNFHIVGANWTLSAQSEPEWHGYGHSRVIDRHGKILKRAKDNMKTEIVFADLPVE